MIKETRTTDPSVEFSKTPERQELIRKIRERDVANWKKFVAGREKERSLADFTKEAARVFIPERLYDFTKDPRKVDVAIIENGDEVLQFFALEHGRKKEAEWDDGDYEALHYMATHPDYLMMEQAIKEGKLSEKDLLLLQYKFVFPPSSRTLEVAQYQDRPELRKKGIGQAVFHEFNRFLDLGFPLIIGKHDENSARWYKEKLGRKPISELSKKEREELGVSGVGGALYDNGSIQYLKSID